MKKFENSEEARDAYIKGTKIAQKAIEQGDSKTNNFIVKEQVSPAFKYLEENNNLSLLVEILKGDDIVLKQPIAVALLPYYEDIAISVLEDIIKQDIPFRSFIAKTVLKNWKK